MTANYGDPMPKADAIELMKNVYENGVTFWDTAEAYCCEMPDGTTLFNESVLGDAIRTLSLPRDQLQLATKYMPTTHGDTMTPETCVAAAKASCERLGVDCIDLYYVHRFHPKVPMEEQARAMLAVKEAGLATHIGVSEFAPESLQAFHAICPVTAIQNEWSLMNRDLEEQLVPVCRELGIGIVAYSPLSRSLLTGTVTSVEQLSGGSADNRPARYPRFLPENISANAKLVEGVKVLASERGLTPAQLSLAWVASQGEDVVPIPGTTKIANLLSNVAAQSGGAEKLLSAEECALVAAAVPHDQVVGERYTGGDAATWKGNL